MTSPPTKPKDELLLQLQDGAVQESLRRVMPEAPKAEAQLRTMIGRRLKLAREMNGLTQVEAAARMGYANSTQVSLLEGATRLPTLVMLLHAAAVYAVPVDYLLGLSDEPERDPRMAARISALAATRSIVDEAVSSITDRIERNLASSGLHQSVIEQVSQAVTELVAAFDTLRRLSGDEFDDLRGGPRLERAIKMCQELMPRIDEARRGGAVHVAREACRADPSAEIKPMLQELMEAIRRHDDLIALASLGGRAMAVSRSHRRGVREAMEMLSAGVQSAFPGMELDTRQFKKPS